MNTNTNQPKISMDELPPEMIFEIAKYLKPADLGKLYGTCKCMKKLLIPYQSEAKELHLRQIFNMLDDSVNPYSILAFDYFSADNDKTYSGNHI
jgi:hypothetical protein